MKAAGQTLQSYKEVYLRPALDSGPFNSGEAKFDNRAQALRGLAVSELVNSDGSKTISRTQAPVNPVVQLSEAGYAALVREEDWL